MTIAQPYAQHDEPHHQHVGGPVPDLGPAAADRSQDTQAFQGARLAEEALQYRQQGAGNDGQRDAGRKEATRE